MNAFKSFDFDMILLDATLIFSSLTPEVMCTSRISSWHKYSVAAKAFSVIHVPAQRISLDNGNFRRIEGRWKKSVS